MDIPVKFKERMSRLLGEEYDSFLAAYERNAYKGLRLNPLKLGGDPVKEEDLRNILTERFDLKPVPWCRTGFYYDEEFRPGLDPLHQAGAYYIQEPSAMVVGELANVKPGMKVLDLCAAPGGKTSHLAGALKGEGLIWANEIVPQRAEILSRNVERMGIANAIVSCASPAELALALPGFFDVIVVDSPCSGEGMFRRDEIARTEWSKENVAMCAKRSRDILESANLMLKNGGRLIYSTCTFAVEEDEGAICDFLDRHPEYSLIEKELVPVSGSDVNTYGFPTDGRPEWCDNRDEVRDTYRLWPHLLAGEGHFAAVMCKGSDRIFARFEEGEAVAGEDCKKGRKKGARVDNLTEDAIKAYREFEKKSMTVSLNGRMELKGDNLYLMTFGEVRTDRIRILRNGLWLGTVKKNRFEPSHSLAMALHPDEVGSCIELRDKGRGADADNYLKGETIGCDSDVTGWVLCTIEGCSLGWGKATGGVVKNHYPKGLRVMG